MLECLVERKAVAMKRILVCLDGSSRGPGVLAAAVEAAGAHDAKLILFRSVGLPPDVPQDFWKTTEEPLVDVLKRLSLIHICPDVERLSAINAQRGSARAFARTVHDIIDWRGQRRTFFQRANELSALPPIAVFWGDRDTVIPVSHAEALAKYVDNVRVTRFDCGHYPHHEKPDAFVDALRDFLDSPDARPALSLIHI